MKNSAIILALVIVFATLFNYAAVLADTTEKVIVTKELDSIEITHQPKKTSYITGETFKKKGMKVKARFKVKWSDGSESYISEKVSDYIVDQETSLMPTDTEWKVTYWQYATRYDDWVNKRYWGTTSEEYEQKYSRSAYVKISVSNSKTLKLNYSKKTLYPGDTLQLRVIGTDKYVMWSTDNMPAASVSEDGLVQAVCRPGKTKVTATVGTGKKAVELTCTITVKSRLTTDKSAIFLTCDGYETLDITARGNTNVTDCIALSKGSKIIQVDDKGYNYKLLKNIYCIPQSNDGLYNVVPKKSGTETITLYSEMDGSSYAVAELQIPVFIYPDESDTVVLTYDLWKTETGYASPGRIGFYSTTPCLQLQRLNLLNNLIEQGTATLYEKKKSLETVYEVETWKLTVSREAFEDMIIKAIKQGIISYPN